MTNCVNYTELPGSDTLGLWGALIPHLRVFELRDKKGKIDQSIVTTTLICKQKLRKLRTVPFFQIRVGFQIHVVFSRVHATLQPALSVHLSVRRSVGQTLLFYYFKLFFVILSHF